LTGTFTNPSEFRSQIASSCVFLYDMADSGSMELGALTRERRFPADLLEETYFRSSAAAVRFAYFLCGDRDLAQDLVQEAFVRMAGRPTHIRGVHDIDAYLRRIVVNLYTSSLRRRRVERAWLARRESKPSVGGPDLAERDAMWRALRALPRRQRAAIVLRFYEDLSEQAAAGALGCSKRALNSLVVRALATLRTIVIRGEDA
jgi:RNA polymerase sigma-70 factor (sigma-E family)